MILNLDELDWNEFDLDALFKKATPYPEIGHVEQIIGLVIESIGRSGRFS